MQKLEALAAENKELKKEIHELKTTYLSELEEVKQDLDRLKKSSPDIASTSPGLYSRVKSIKKSRPQSLHEVATITQSLQDQLALPAKNVNESISGPVPPVYFTLENYAHHKKHNLRWFTLPFYSQPKGYKMCIGVFAGGASVGEGSYLSLLVYFLQGEYDGGLQWPFRGSLKVSLINELRDGAHHSCSIEFNDDNTLVECGRVEGIFERSSGYGKPMFIENDLLGHDQTKDCQYLKYDRLRFIVEEIKLA